MRNTTRILCTALLAGLALGAQAAGMKVTSSAFADGATMPKIHAGDAPGCGGQGVSPPVAWSDLPAGTRSVAVLMSDPDGGKGLGVSHWVAYNIPAAKGQLRQGEGQAANAEFSVGKNVAGATAYRGMCPPAGDLPHHYVLTVIATEAEPGSLPEGLTREELLAALKGRTLMGQSVVGLYGQ